MEEWYDRTTIGLCCVNGVQNHLDFLPMILKTLLSGAEAHVFCAVPSHLLKNLLQYTGEPFWAREPSGTNNVVFFGLSHTVDEASSPGIFESIEYFLTL